MVRIFNHTWAALLISFLSLVNSFAEGTKQCMPNPATDIRFQVFDNGSSARDFMTYIAPVTSRLHIRISDVNNEKIFFGFRQDNGDVYYRLRDPNGNIVMGPSLVPSSGAGYISTYNQAVAGPDILDAVNGYTSQSYIPSIPGDYYIEFNPNDPDNYIDGVSNVKRTFNFFDITVVDMTDTTEIAGRLWANKWDFNCMSASNPFEAEMHILATDSVLTSLDFNGIQPWGFEILANRTGTDITGSVSSDRQSKAGNVNYPEYKLFLQLPDTSTGVFETTKSVPRLTTPASIEGCATDGYNVKLTSSHVGIAEFFIDIDADEIYNNDDVYFLEYMAQGENLYPWDGNDASSNPVPDGTNVKIIIQYQGGLTHIPLYDCENHTNGYNVNLIAPSGGSPEIFWDDSNIGGGTALTQPGCTSNCHTWGTGVGNVNTVNTYWITHYDEDTVDFTILYDCRPVAVDDTVNVPRDTQVSIDVQANDTEPDAESITTSLIPSMGPSNGVAVLNGNNVDYTPNVGFTGNDTMYYEICDGPVPAPVQCDTGMIILQVQCDDDQVPDDEEVAGDADGDGIDNVCDLDSDNDGITDADEGSGDADGDGIPNHIDLDSDNDGIPDAIEANNGVAPANYDPLTGRLSDSDADSDGLLDVVDNDDATAYGATSTSVQTDNDYDGDGVPNRVDKDSDNDGILDLIETGGSDSNGNGELDSFTDSNGDGIDDGTLSTPNANPDTDGIGNPNYLDTDSDNDGINDNREGQTTAGFTSMAAFADADGDGISNQYDTDSGNNPITPLDFDGDGMADYIDTDSDNDSVSDAIEGNDNNTDGAADGAPNSNDNDADGHDDGYESDGGSAYGGYSNYAYQNTDGDSEPDWRDIDDDGDGINTISETADLNSNLVPDYLETSSCPQHFTQQGSVTSGYADAQTNNGTGNPGNALGAPDGNYASVNSGDDITLDLTDTIPVGEQVQVIICTRQTSGAFSQAVFEQSLDGTFIDAYNGTADNPFTYNSTQYRPNYETINYTISGSDARYIRITRTSRGNALDAISYSFTTCIPDWDMDGVADATDIDDDNDGVPDASEGVGDTDGDGIIDSNDLDSDNDGIPDAVEANDCSLPANMDAQGFFTAAYLSANDGNGDGLVDGTALPDNDTDSDGLADRIDLDSDGDGITDGVEANSGSLPANMDSNGQFPVAYATANDSDTDGLVDDVDTDASGSLLTNPDTDGDGTCDYRDTDSDDDGTSDNLEGFDPDNTPSGTDTDGDGIDDAFDTDNGGTSANLPDADSDGTPDYIDVCYVSTQNGNWTDASTWGGSGAPSSCNDCAVINHTVTLTGASFVSNLDISGSGQLVLAGNDIDLCGDLTLAAGGSISGSGTLNMSGSSAQTICGDATVESLTINNAAGVSFCSGSDWKITDILTLTQGVFDMTNATAVTLCSNAAGTALISGAGTGTLSGDLTQQRYIPGCAGYLTLGAPFNTTFQGFNNAYYQGFPSAFPGYWTNVMLYDETVLDVSDSGYYNPADITVAINKGVGFLNYNWSIMFPRTLSLTGPYSMDAFALPITYSSSTAGNNHDGFNLVANPFPGTLDWDAASGWTIVNCCNAIYTYNRCVNQYSSYVDGISVNGGTRYVSPMAGFWVKAHSAGSSITVSRDALVDEQQPLYRSTDRKTLNIIMESAGYTDELAISFGDTTATHGQGYWYGAVKLPTNIPNYPRFYSIQTYPWDSYDMSINVYPDDYLFDGQIVQLMSKAEFAGTYTLTFRGMESYGTDVCILLEDTVTGAFTNVQTDTVYTFSTGSNVDPVGRFKVHYGLPLSSYSTDAECDNGKIVAEASTPSQLVWSDINGNILYQTDHTATMDSLTDLEPGIYNVTMIDTSNQLCPSVSKSMVINEIDDTAMYSFNYTHDTLCNQNVGTANVEVLGGNSPYSYYWSNGNTTTALTGLNSGIYVLNLTDSIGCEKTFVANVDAPDIISAYIAPINGNDTLYIQSGNAIAEFVNYSVNEDSITVLFGDGNSIATALDTLYHNYTDTGLYQVQVIGWGDCPDTMQTSIVVLDTTPVVITCSLSVSLSVTDVTVFGGTDGSVQSNINGEQGSLSYIWSNGETTASISGLNADSYSVTVTDDIVAGCTTTQNAVVTEPGSTITCNLSVTLNGTDITVGESSNGSAEAIYSGEQGNIIYQWSNGQTTAQLTGLEAGTYTVTITDDILSDCVAIDSILLTQEIDTTSSLIELGSTSFKVYPNPSNDIFFVEFENHAPQKISILIVNSSGQRVYARTQIVQHIAKVDLSNNANGVYLLQIVNHEGEISRKRISIVK